MVLIGKLDDRTSELGKVSIDEILQIVAGKNCLFLKNAHMSPCIDDLGFHIPKCRITDQICIVMKEAGGADDLSVACSFHIDHLGGFGTEQHDKTVFVLLLLVLCRKRKTRRKRYED